MSGSAPPDLDAAATARLRQHLDELFRWNPRLNLTSVAPSQAWHRHVEESLGLIAAVATANRGTPARWRVVDVGSGGGFPGIPAAVLWPECAVTLLEADRRKAAFLVHVSGLLEAANVDVCCQRAEDHGRSSGRGAYDLAISRATAPAATLAELTLPLLATGGLLAALVSDAAAAAVEAAAASRACGGGIPAIGPGVLLVRKLQPTPARYPRRNGVPQRRPLS